MNVSPVIRTREQALIIAMNAESAKLVRDRRRSRWIHNALMVLIVWQSTLLLIFALRG